MSAIDYTPRAGSLPGKVCKHMLQFPQAILSKEQIATRWDVSAVSVHTQLNAAVGADYLTRYSHEGVLSYKAGPNIRRLAGLVGSAPPPEEEHDHEAQPPAPPPAAAPASGPWALLNDRPASAPSPAPAPQPGDSDDLDLLACPIDYDVPPPTRVAKRGVYVEFLQRFDVKGSKRLPNKIRSRIDRAAVKVRKASGDRINFTITADGDEHFRIWRMPDQQPNQPKGT